MSILKFVNVHGAVPTTPTQSAATVPQLDEQDARKLAEVESRIERARSVVDSCRREHRLA